MVQFVTLIERNAGRISLPEDVSRLLGQELPDDYYFYLDVGPVIAGIINRHTGSILTSTHDICQAYGGVESVEASITYNQDGRFSVARIMPEVASDGSDSTDPDYWKFLAGYDGDDDGSDTASDAGSSSVVTQL